MNKKSRNLTPKKQAQAENEAARAHATSGEEQAGKPDGLCWTTTGEVFQPVRIYYEALKIMKILKIFNNLKCMDFDEAKPRWVWLYTGEAAHLGFRKPAVNPKHPVALGSFIRFYDDLMYLDVNSMERALAAITFFDKHLPRAAARLWYLSLINRVFSYKEAQQFDANQYFDARMEFVDPAEQLTEQLETLSAAAPDDDERMARLQRFFAEREAAPLAEVEHFAIRYYDEGLTPLQLIMNTRQRVALEHWKGHEDYTRADYLAEIAHHK